MGDWSEGRYQEMLGICDVAGNPEEEEPLSRDSYWTTKERQRIPVYAMEDGHLLNTIRVLRGKSPIGTTIRMDNVRRREWLNVMANEAYSRGLSIEEVDDNDPTHE